MAEAIMMPALGQSMEEGTITQWFKNEGDPVAKGELLFEVMTDKANIEQESEVDGFLRKIVVPVDGTVPINTLIAVIGGRDEPIDSIVAGNVAVADAGNASVAFPPAASPAVTQSSSERIFISPRARTRAAAFGISCADMAGRGTGPEGRIVEADVRAYQAEIADLAAHAPKISPLAQRVAQANGIDPTALAGTGSGQDGKLLRNDVERAIAVPAPTAAAAYADDDEIRVIPLVGKRKLIADNVSRSKFTAPHVTVTLAVDMSETMRFRKQVLPSIEKSHGVRVTFTDIIAKAVSRALIDHPLLNSTLVDNKISLYKHVHLGIAVSLGQDGLVVPVVRASDTLSLPNLSVAIKKLAAKARDGKLEPDEMNGGTFTITNIGTFGVEQFNPIINPPQSAILGVCAIVEKPVVVAGEVVIRPMMNRCLSFDHRVTDGAPAAAFLAWLKEILEQPYLIFTA